MFVPFHIVFGEPLRSARSVTGRSKFTHKTELRRPLFVRTDPTSVTIPRRCVVFHKRLPNKRLHSASDLTDFAMEWTTVPTVCRGSFLVDISIIYSSRNEVEPWDRFLKFFGESKLWAPIFLCWRGGRRPAHNPMIRRGMYFYVVYMAHYFGAERFMVYIEVTFVCLNRICGLNNGQAYRH